MKKHQTVAIVVGLILVVMSYIPVLISYLSGAKLGHPLVMTVFIFPTIGATVAAVIVFLSFFRSGNGE
jgi:hypothetical protein